MAKPSGYEFEIRGDIVKEYECPICLLLIRDAVEIPCGHIMCNACLDSNEQRMTQNRRNVILLCPLCKSKYEKFQRHNSKALDKIITTSLKVKCKQGETGCDWIGCIADHKDHSKTCLYLVIKCDNGGCQLEDERRKIIDHVSNCQYRKVSCQHCQQNVQLIKMKEHYSACSSYPVRCKNDGCTGIVKRNEVGNHYQTECNYEKVACDYHKVGCNEYIRRIDMEDHNNLSTQKHMSMMMKNHSNKLQETEARIEVLEQEVKIKDVRIKELETSSINKHKKSEDRIKVLEQEVEARMKGLEITVKDKDARINELETFSDRVAGLHVILAINNPSLPNMGILSEHSYEANEAVKDWKEQVQDVGLRENKSVYLKKFDSALELYKLTVLPLCYKDRYKQALNNSIPTIEYLLGDKSYYFFHNIEESELILVKYTNDRNVYEKELNRDKRWIRISLEVASFYNMNCLCLSLCSTYSEKCYLLHGENKADKQEIPHGEIVRMNEQRNWIILEIENVKTD